LLHNRSLRHIRELPTLPNIPSIHLYFDGSEGQRSIDRLIKMILLMTIADSRNILEGSVVRRKNLRKYVCRLKDPKRTYRRRSIFGSGNDSQQWINYLEKYAEPVEELMNLTRNKRHFYQRARAGCNLAQARFLAIFVTPPALHHRFNIRIRIRNRISFCF
jgi:hypothetical protein